MRKWLIAVVVVIVAIGLGIGAAMGTVPLVRSKATKLSQTAATGRPSFPSKDVPGFSRPWEGPGSRMGEKWWSGNDWGSPGGMMGGFSRNGCGCGNSPWGKKFRQPESGGAYHH